MADGSVIIDVDVDTSKANKELENLKKDIKKTESTINEQEAKRSPLVAQAERLQREMKEARAEVERYRQEWLSGVTGADVQQSKAQERLNQMEADYNDIAQKIDKIDETLIPAYDKLEGMENEAGKLQQEINKAEKNTRKMGAATENADKKMGGFAKRLKRIALGAFVFNIISSGFRKMTDWIGKTITSNEKARAAIAKLKGALLTLAQPIVEIIIPAFVYLVNLLTAIVTRIGAVIAGLFGTTWENASKSAEALYKEQEAIEGVGEAAKEATKQIASFDEINQLSAENGSGASFDKVIKPDFDAFKISSGMETVLSVVRKIGIVILSWALSKKLTSGINSLLSLGGKKLTPKVAIGISLISAGAGIIADNIVSILAGEYGATSLEAAVNEAIGALMLGAGAMVLGAGAWAFPVAAVLTVGITNFIVNWDKIKTMWSHILDGLGALFTKEWAKADYDFSQAFLAWLNMDAWHIDLVRLLIDAVGGEGAFVKFKKYFEDGFTLLRSPFNFILGLVERLANGIVTGVNGMIKAANKLKSITSLFGGSSGQAASYLPQISVPKLAQGAVIPPNREFLAVLGDQTSGNNLEAPEGLIRKIVREEAGGGVNDYLLREILEAIRAGKVITVGKKQLGQVVAEALSDRERSAGTSVLATR